MLVLSILNIAGGVRIIRGAALEQRALPYVEAARTLGVPRWRIMYLHIWRNISPIVFANAALDFALALVALSSLSYLGLGSQHRDAPEWGRMLSENQSLLFTNPAGVLAPGLAIVLLRDGGDDDRRLDLRPILVQRQNGPLTWPLTHQLLDVRGLRVEYVAGSARQDARRRASTCGSTAGETIAIVGESGSGKSLTARAIIAAPPDGVGRWPAARSPRRPGHALR